MWMIRLFPKYVIAIFFIYTKWYCAYTMSITGDVNIMGPYYTLLVNFTSGLNVKTTSVYS